jgi:hypothetical protein
MSSGANIFEYSSYLTQSSQRDRAAVYVALSAFGVLLTTILSFTAAAKDQNSGIAVLGFLSWAVLLLILIAQSIQLNGLMTAPSPK